jgi:glycosyltransferase involved in cell wall biosynthesis
MSSAPLVSIGIPVFNGEMGIEEAISSLLKQSYTNFEIVISDNGSTDGTFEIIHRLSRMNSKIRIFRSESNRGSIWNFNKVFEESVGKYFMWAAHDDTHDPSFIAECVYAMEADSSAVLCVAQTQMKLQSSEKVIWISSMQSFLGKDSLHERYRETIRNFPAVGMYGLYRRESLLKTSLFPKVIGGDLLMIQELSIFGKFIEVPKILFTYHGRESWNTVNQDYMTFFGKEIKPWYYSPFFMVLVKQVHVLLKADIGFTERTRLFSTLFRYQVEQFFLKLALKNLRLFIPLRYKPQTLIRFYWKFMNGPNVFMVEEDLFVKRIIMPRVGLRG